MMQRLLIFGFFLMVWTVSAKPNIVIYLSDDHGKGDSGPYGNKAVRTPTLDALAKESLVFDRAFASSPTCTPSRSSIYTGLYPMRNGAHGNHSRINDRIKTWPAYFKDLGYRVVLIGKTHIAPRKNFDFEYIDAHMVTNGPPLTEEFNPTRVEQFLTSHMATNKSPLCLIIADWNPHVFWTENHGYDPATVDLPPYLFDTKETREMRTRYYSDVTLMDTTLHTCLESIQQHGLGDALFIYTSDQGAQWPHAKWNLYDAGIAVPFMIHWPGHVTPGRNNALVSMVDLLPTLLEVGGGKAPKGIDGQSFLPVILGKKKEFHQEIYAAHTGDGEMNKFPCRCLRTATEKYILNLDPNHIYTSHITSANAEDGRYYWDSWVAAAKTNAAAAAMIQRDQHRPAEEYYDLTTDPDELHNQIENPHYAKRIATLREKLAKWRTQQGEP